MNLTLQHLWASLFNHCLTTPPHHSPIPFPLTYAPPPHHSNCLHQPLYPPPPVTPTLLQPTPPPIIPHQRHHRPPPPRQIHNSINLRHHSRASTAPPINPSSPPIHHHKAYVLQEQGNLLELVDSDIGSNYSKKKIPMNFQPPQHGWHPGPTEIPSEPPSKEGETTLLIRHLPEAIPQDTLSRLFSHYNASSVRPCSNVKLRNCAFVDFKNDFLASQAHRQLNGLRFLGKVLKVERANNKPSHSGKNEEQAKTNDASVIKDIEKGFKLESLCKNKPIAEKLGIDYSFPPHLEYAYPPPDGNILKNIENALIAVPQFYTQVLHLMNKMNIPAPFRMALPTPPFPPPLEAPPPPPPPPQLDTKPAAAELSSDESELESSDEESSDRKRKRVKRESIVGPAVDKGVAHEAVGLKQAKLVPKEVPLIKKKNPVLQIKIIPKKVETFVEKDSSVKGKEKLNSNPFVTPEELESGKLPPEEILSLPMFKNYSAGNPSPVLYIKNLAKDVDVDDFYFIFGSIFGDIDTAKASLGIKLMQEGRMRGQAFVTFSSTELSHRALKLANGYVFKGKPMIIQFGRNPSAGKTN